MDTTHEALQVTRQMLGEDFASPEEFHQRPGGKSDPHRQVTMKMKFGKKDFTGKRPKGAAKPPEEDEPKEKKNPRFKLNFEGEYLGNMESSRDTAERVVKRLLGETTEPAAAPAAAPAPAPQPRTPVREASASSTSVGKAWKKGKKTAGSGHSVAGKPGKVGYKGESYRDQLIRSVNEKLKMKKAGKGTPVAKAPGGVSYKKEDLSEKMGSGMKGGKAKKLLNTIAKKPGAVSYGKK